VKQIWAISLMVFVLTSISYAQITRTATFENFTVGEIFKPSFTDSGSGITFSNSTGPTQDFEITDGLSEFGYSNYLSSGSTAPGWSYQFGFTGGLLSPSNYVSLKVSDGGSSNATGLTLEGFNSVGMIIVQQSGSSIESDPFTLQITSSQYDITSFKVIAAGIFTGYDNISYTILPEPASISFLLLSSIIPSQICRAKGSAQ
jgi:hypothetical protein